MAIIKALDHKGRKGGNPPIDSFNYTIYVIPDR